MSAAIIIPTPRPIQTVSASSTIGTFRKEQISGTMAAGLAANSVVWAWRWTDATRLAIVPEITIGAGGIVGFTAGFFSFALFFGRSYTASHTGGTAGTLTGNNSKLKTSFGTMLLGDTRIATTGALGGGTVTLDTDALARLTGSTTAVAGTLLVPPFTPIFPWDDPSSQPLVFAQNEGLVLQATVPATGTWTFSVGVKWYEIPAGRYP